MEKGDNIVVLKLKRPLHEPTVSSLEPPTKSMPIPSILPSRPEYKRTSPPMDKPPKKRTNKLKFAGESINIGDCIYVTDRKCIARVDSIDFPIDNSQPIFLDVTWQFL